MKKIQPLTEQPAYEKPIESELGKPIEPIFVEKKFEAPKEEIVTEKVQTTEKNQPVTHYGDIEPLTEEFRQDQLVEGVMNAFKMRGDPKTPAPYEDQKAYSFLDSLWFTIYEGTKGVVSGLDSATTPSNMLNAAGMSYNFMKGSLNAWEKMGEKDKMQMIADTKGEEKSMVNAIATIAAQTITMNAIPDMEDKFMGEVGTAEDFSSTMKAAYNDPKAMAFATASTVAGIARDVGLAYVTKGNLGNGISGYSNFLANQALTSGSSAYNGAKRMEEVTGKDMSAEFQATVTAVAGIATAKVGLLFVDKLSKVGAKWINSYTLPMVEGLSNVGENLSEQLVRDYSYRKAGLEGQPINAFWAWFGGALGVGTGLHLNRHKVMQIKMDHARKVGKKVSKVAEGMSTNTKNDVGDNMLRMAQETDVKVKEANNKVISDIVNILDNEKGFVVLPENLKGLLADIKTKSHVVYENSFGKLLDNDKHGYLRNKYGDDMLLGIQYNSLMDAIDAVGDIKIDDATKTVLQNTPDSNDPLSKNMVDHLTRLKEIKDHDASEVVGQETAIELKRQIRKSMPDANESTILNTMTKSLDNKVPDQLAELYSYDPKAFVDVVAGLHAKDLIVKSPLDVEDDMAMISNGQMTVKQMVDGVIASQQTATRAKMLMDVTQEVSNIVSPHGLDYEVFSKNEIGVAEYNNKIRQATKLIETYKSKLEFRMSEKVDADPVFKQLMQPANIVSRLHYMIGDDTTKQNLISLHDSMKSGSVMIEQSKIYNSNWIKDFREVYDKMPDTSGQKITNYLHTIKEMQDSAMEVKVGDYSLRSGDTIKAVIDVATKFELSEQEIVLAHRLANRFDAISGLRHKNINGISTNLSADYKNLPTFNESAISFKGAAYIPVLWSDVGAKKIADKYSDQFSSADEVNVHSEKARSLGSELRFDPANVLNLDDTLRTGQSIQAYKIGNYAMRSDFKKTVFSYYGSRISADTNAKGKIDWTSLKKNSVGDMFSELDRAINDRSFHNVLGKVDAIGKLINPIKNTVVLALINPFKVGAWLNVAQPLNNSGGFNTIKSLGKNLPSGLKVYGKHLLKNGGNIEATMNDILNAKTKNPVLDATMRDYVENRYAGSLNTLADLSTGRDSKLISKLPKQTQKVANYFMGIATDYYTGSDFAARTIAVKAGVETVQQVLRKNGWQAKNADQAVQKANKIIAELGLSGAGSIENAQLKKYYNDGLKSGNMQKFVNEAVYTMVDKALFHYDIAHTPIALSKIRSATKLGAVGALFTSWAMYDAEWHRQMFSQGFSVKKQGRKALIPLVRYALMTATGVAINEYFKAEEGEKPTALQKTLEKQTVSRAGLLRMGKTVSDKFKNPLGMYESMFTTANKAYKYYTNERYRNYRERKGLGHPFTNFGWDIDKPLLEIGQSAWDLVDQIGSGLSEKEQKNYYKVMAPIVGEIALEEIDINGVDFETIDLDDNE